MTLLDEPTVPKPAATRRRMPGDLDMWVMVLGDLVIFGSYFVSYMVYRAKSPEVFAAGQQHLTLGLGMVNTVVLLTGSMFAALAVISIREGSARLAERLIWATGACGVLFAAVKLLEWGIEIDRGATLHDEFFSFYFVITGVHLVHLMLSLVILGVVVRELRNPQKQRVSIVEQGALFWHMVDLLWVVIFAILYLMRGGL